MKLSYKPLKAAQTTAYMIGLHGGQISLMALIKLLYLADRKALVDTGYTITGDAMVSMDHGPVLMRIYDNTKSDWGNEDDPWREYISDRAGYQLSLIKSNPPTSELSKYEMEILKQIHDEYGQLSASQLRRLTHELPEWNDPHGSSSPIDPIKILEEDGKSENEIARIVNEAQQEFAINRLLSK